MGTWNQDLTTAAIGLLCALLAALIACVPVATRYVIGWINSKRKHEETTAQEEAREKRQRRVEEFIATAVLSTKQTFVDGIKAKAATGKLTLEDGKEAMAKTMATLRKHLLNEGLKFSDAYMSEMLVDYIEEAVARLKS